jgi:N-dimethylarginine dimethylaminohydrolase
MNTLTTFAALGNQAGPRSPNARQPARRATRFVMCPPVYLSTRIPNNVWMKGEKIDTVRAMKQFGRITNVIRALGVEILLIPPQKNCQDQTYVANIGIALNPFIVLANYKAPGRACEVEPARKFFEAQGYRNIVQPPFHFEGEADLKKFTDKVYFGGWGQFSDPKAYRWIEQKTGIKVVLLHEVNPKVYHLDCSLLVVDDKNLVVTKEGLDAKSLATLEKMANVILTPPEVAITGVTNAVLIPEKKIVLSGTFNPETPQYRKAMEWMNATFDRFGYTCVFLDVDEFDKSGADLSCCVFHLDF